MDDVAAGVSLGSFGIAEHEGDILLDLAETAIRHRLARRDAPPLSANVPTSLRRPAGVFVTLHVADELNGCVGNIDGTRSLAVSVSALAVEAALADPRLPALRVTDLSRLRIEISLLSPQVEIPSRSRTELERQLRPDEHGLVVRRGTRRALFLPTVWRQLPSTEHFVDRLLHKAGLPRDTWPADLAATVFTTTTVNRHLG